MPEREKTSKMPINLLKYRKSAACGQAAYTISPETTHFAGPVTPPGEFFNRVLV
jgi:hypothetical protein